MATTKLGATLTCHRLFAKPARKPSAPFAPSVPGPASCSSSSSSSSRARAFDGRRSWVWRRALVIPVKATADQQGKVEGGESDVEDSKILPYCSIDKKEKKSIGELEQEFLQALQSFYYEGKAIMSNEEFDNLKEELMWEGSSVVMLTSDEQRFLEASMAYVSGNPIMNDQEYDDLKLKLKIDGSEIVVEGPRCSLRSRKVYSDLSVDYLKMLLLNVPATVIALGLFFFLDDITGFEITYLLELPEPFSFIFTWFAALPLIVYLALSLTNVIVKDSLILKVKLHRNPSLNIFSTLYCETVLKDYRGCRVPAPTAARRMSPSLAPYCPSLAAVELTMLNAQTAELNWCLTRKPG